MKKILLFTLLSSFSIVSFAESPECSMRDVHCSYFVGNDAGRYVKVHSTVNGIDRGSDWMCVKHDSAITIQPEEMQYHYNLGDQVRFQYVQCADADCKRNIDIGYEEFIIKKTYDDDYYSTPYRYAVHLKGGYGKPCSMPKTRIKGVF